MYSISRPLCRINERYVCIHYFPPSLYDSVTFSPSTIVLRIDAVGTFEMLRSIGWLT